MGGVGVGVGVGFGVGVGGGEGGAGDAAAAEVDGRILMLILPGKFIRAGSRRRCLCLCPRYFRQVLTVSPLDSK